MEDLRALPDDFAGRLRAARAYAGIGSQAKLAELLSGRGTSAGNLKAWEEGARAPDPIIAQALVAQLAEATQLPEGFFWGAVEPTEEPEVRTRLAALEPQVRHLRAEVADLVERLAGLDDRFQILRNELSTRDMAALTRYEEVLAAIRSFREQQPG